MQIKSYFQQISTSLWSNNVVFKQALALCPTLAVTNSATNGLGMGLATLMVVMLSNTVISMIRQWVRAGLMSISFMIFSVMQPDHTLLGGYNVQ